MMINMNLNTLSFGTGICFPQTLHVFAKLGNNFHPPGLSILEQCRENMHEIPGEDLHSYYFGSWNDSCANERLSRIL